MSALGGDHAPARVGGRSAHWALVVALRDDDIACAVHGVSRVPLVTPTEALQASNAQLFEADPDEPAYRGRALRLRDRVVLLAPRVNEAPRRVAAAPP